MALFSRKRAKKVLDEGAANQDPQKVEQALENRQKIMDRVVSSSSLSPYFEQVKTLFQMLQDYAKGQYREIPWWSIGSIATALLYILMPFDALPDFIPIAGFLDDAVVLKLCLDLVGKDLQQYRESRSALDRESDLSE